MAKILLVEDDNNLREIYEARLNAEGYDIVSARDGEEALTIAMKERPDLIISDVMMPKISGFDMLDILRTTEETKNAKIIMMTALSQAEDKARAEKLGADRYLVKSQVTLEDVAKVAREVLEGTPAPAEPTATAMPAPASDPVAAPAVAVPAMPVASEPAQAAPAPMPEPVVAAPAVEPPTAAPTPAPASDPVAAPAAPVAAPAASDPSSDALAATPVAAPAATPADDITEPKRDKVVIQPINDLTANQSDKLQQLLAEEEKKEQMRTAVQEAIAPAVKEETAIAQQIESNMAQAAPAAQTEAAPLPTPVTPPPAAAPSDTDPNAIAL